MSSIPFRFCSSVVVVRSFDHLLVSYLWRSINAILHVDTFYFTLVMNIPNDFVSWKFISHSIIVIVFAFFGFVCFIIGWAQQFLLIILLRGIERKKKREKRTHMCVRSVVCVWKDERPCWACGCSTQLQNVDVILCLEFRFYFGFFFLVNDRIIKWTYMHLKVEWEEHENDETMLNHGLNLIKIDAISMLYRHKGE